MNKKGILACFMAVCMLLISMVSVSAGSYTYTTEPWTTIPEEGVSITFADLTYLPNYTGSDFDFLFKNANEFGLTTEMTGNTDPAKFFPQSAANSMLLKGALLSADVEYYPDVKNKEVKRTYHFDDAVVTGCYPSGDLTKLRLGIKKADVAAKASNIVLEDGTTPDTLTADQVGTPVTEGNSFKLTNAVLKPGTAPLYKSSTAEYNHDPFPNGSVFLSAEKFTPGTLKISPDESWDGYRFFYQGTGHNIIFVSKFSGTYDIWTLTSSYSASTEDRTPTIVINDEVTATVPVDTTNYENSTGKAAIWAKTNGQVTLTEGQIVRVVVDCPGNARFGALALVPSDAEDKPAANFRTKSGVAGFLSINNIMDLQSLTTNELTPGPAVENVEVRWEKITVPAWSAKNKGASVPNVDATGALLLNATVTDALYARGILPRTDGKQMIVTLNGKKVVNPDITYIKSGDVINAESYDGFSPIRITDSLTSGGDSAFENIFASGTDGASMRIVFKPTFFTGTKKLDVKTNDLLTGAHFNGYMKPRKAGTTEKLGTMNGYGMMRNQTFDSVNYEYKKTNGEVAYEVTASGDTRVVSYQDAVNVTKVQHIVNDEVIGVLPYKISGIPYDYLYSTMYITDKMTDGKVYVMNNGTHHLITVDGCDDLYILIKTDNDDGTYTTTIQTKVVMFNDPYALTLKDNQTAYIWQNINYSGTTMKPLCEVITNSAE